ncbi:Lrp/AsnC family transcriptional regulator [uncultured Jatrophihabitans sp.]|uniref:Lrp/AsnC family transcriptional regulator n=1 Tax=uncultured Jatrophihabitans sp. TaxID=1610747 RepID=UPI0035C9D756
MLSETATVDELDAKIIRGLQLSPRIPFRVLAEILRVSEQTAARRYRRMQKAGIVRVTAVLSPTALRQSNWVVRVRCKPSGAVSLAQALAQRDDLSWVTLAAGGSEILCVLRSRTTQAREELLMQRLPRTAPVLDISAAMLLHRFIGAGRTATDDWAGLADLLDDDETRAVLETMDLQPPAADARYAVDADDLTLVELLTADGRTSYARLAQGLGVTEARAARRLRALVEGGALYLDVDVSVADLGMRCAATLWLSVTPAELHRAGEALALTPEVAFAGAITGPQNLTATVVCRDVEHLYSFVTARVGAIAGVQSLEVVPVLRHVKQAGAMVDGHRLAPAPQ